MSGPQNEVSKVTLPGVKNLWEDTEKDYISVINCYNCAISIHLILQQNIRVFAILPILLETPWYEWNDIYDTKHIRFNGLASASN